MEKVTRFRYAVVALGIRYAVNPLFSNTPKLKGDREGNSIFIRRKLSGALIFTKGDFALLHNLEISAVRCQEVLFLIERQCAGEYLPEWSGVFSLNEVQWDLDKCTAEVTPRLDDKYRLVLDYYTKEFNVLQSPATDTVEVKLDFEGQFEFKIIRGGTLFDMDDSDTWGVFLESRYWIAGQGLQKGIRDKTDIIFRLITTRPVVAGEYPDLGNGWTVVDVDEVAKVAKYAKAPDLYNFTPYHYRTQASFDRYPDLKQIPCGQAYDTARYINVSAPGQAVSDSCGNSCMNFRKKVKDERCVTLLWEFGAFYFNRNRRLLNIIKFLLRQTCPDLEPNTPEEISEFFSSPTNYVTAKPNPLKDLLLAHKSDILAWNSSEPATKGMLSLKNLLEDLGMFGLKWFINGAGKFQIEHPAYFERLAVVDLTDLAKYPLLRGTRAYRYETEKMPRFEKLTFSGAFNEDFTGGLIEYAGACVTYTEGQDTQETIISRITTDLEYLLVSSGSDKNGFVLLCQHDGKVPSATGALTGQKLINAPLAAANIVQDYYTHERVLESGLVNGRFVEFKSMRRTRRQVPLIVPACCGEEYHPLAEYRTTLAEDGELVGSELDLASATITLDIAFPSAGSGAVVPARQFDDSFPDSFA